MNFPKVTVYVPCHNYGRFLTEAVESILRQTYGNWELLIIDEASTDNTAEIMQLYEGDERIRLYHTEGIGLHAVCNMALYEGRGEYIIRLDADDVFDENALLVLASYLDSNPDIALVFPDYHLVDEFGEIFAHKKRQKLYQNNHSLDVPPHGACFLARRQIIIDLGGYREDLKAQDGYYIWSKLIVDHKCANVNLPLFYYRKHGSNLSSQIERKLEARRQIKKETILSQLDNFKPFIAVIPCRTNYEFCVDLWDRTINGKKLLQYSLEACIASSIFDHIVVACDNPAAEAVALQYGDPRVSFYRREQRSTLRSEKIVPTLEKISNKFDPNKTGVSVLAYVKCPFVSTDSLEEAIFTLVMNNSDSSFCVEEIERPVYRRDAYGLTPVNPPTGISNDFQKLYTQTWSTIASRHKNFKTGSLEGTKIVNFVATQKEVFCIDSEKKLKMAPILIEENDVKKKKRNKKQIGSVIPFLNSKK